MRTFSKFILFSILILSAGLFFTPAYAKDTVKVELDPIPCTIGGGSCPSDLESIYDKRGESCVPTFDEFKLSPTTNHFWMEDPEVKAQGQSNERARQFMSWVLSKNAIDDHPTIKAVWNITRNLAYFFVILLAAIFGIGLIVGRRTNFDFKIKIWPSVGKIIGSLLFITFSASLILLFIQLSELLMKFFMENLGGKDLFNIYFSAPMSQEANYLLTPGCRDLNYGVQEAARTEILMMKLTNLTYYVMGIMILLRKIILWFLLFASPFLAILFPFVFIRNIGWIWIGVFFQWLFYGPLFSLFLGALSKIWKEGIPFIFDFQRAGTADGYIYPTAISILYGGPAQRGTQRLSVLNNGNYIDTFAEYIITLIMLWAVIVLPWWLLRIFRDYCCDGINAMKNILLSKLDHIRNGPTPPSPSPAGTPAPTATTLHIKQDIGVPTKLKLETIEEIKKTKTEEIVRSLNMSATKLTDIARLETNRQNRVEIKQNLDYLTSPTKAQTPTDRQKYMNLRTELFNRAVKEDHIAKQILSATSTSAFERVQNKQAIFKTAPQLTPVTQTVSYKVKLPAEKVSSVTTSITNALTSQSSIVNTIAQKTAVSASQVQTILTSYRQKVHEPPAQIVTNVAKETGIEKNQVINVLKEITTVIKENKEIAKQVAQQEQITEEDVQKIVASQIPLTVEPEKHIEQSISIPATVAIEDYEEVKKMWIQQYEKGEVPVTENVASRNQWIDQDIVFITNTLNKLLSPDEKLKSEGLDEVGFLLPIFMVNNFKGEELLVYLKAKLEAAKQVQEQMEKEREITDKLKAKSEEVLVDVAATKKEEAAKTMTMEEHLEIPDEKKT